jgi:hypothetical protein
MKVVRYQLQGFPSQDMKFIKRTLDDPRGHAGNGHCFRRCRKPNEPDVIMRLTPRHVIDELFGDDGELANLSVTDFSGHPRKIYIDHKNWQTIPKGFTGCHTTYKQYLLQHEMGHAIGLFHHDHPLHGQTHPGKCPVMYQQTKGTPMCEANPWLYPDKRVKKGKSSKKKKRKQTRKQRKKQKHGKKRHKTQ